MSSMIQMQRVHPNAKLPIRGTRESAGLDLFAVQDFALFPDEQKLIPTGIRMRIPEGTVGLIKPRSKLANKFGIDTLAGVIDSDYRGEVHVILKNFGAKVLDVRRGDAIAQLLVQLTFITDVQEVSELDDTERGTNGILDGDARR